MNLGNKKSNLLFLLAAFVLGGCGNFSGNYEEIETSVSSESSEFTTTTNDNTTPSFVAVGGPILTSSDGISWTTSKSTGSSYLEGVTYGNRTLVVVGNLGTIFSSSSDGTSWTLRSSGTSNALHDITFGNSTFVAVSSSGTVHTSSDYGTSWTSINLNCIYCSAIIYKE